MNGIPRGMNDPAAHYRRASRCRKSIGMGQLTTEFSIDRDVRPLVWRACAILILCFWVVQYTYLTIPRMMFEGDSARFLLPRAVVTLGGILISFAMLAIQSALAAWPLWPRLLVTMLMTVAACCLHGLTNYIVFYRIIQPDGEQPFIWLEYMPAMMDWTWFYASLSGMIVALFYSADLRDRERRLARLAAQAHAAEVRSIRYQLNPHFLFNTLNSIAALVGARQNRPAETMVENLSDFLRAGLALDPHDDIPLAREMELQALYLEIERSRYPGRLAFDTDVPERLNGVRVPSLITQPLIEAAVRLSVARSTTPVQLTVRGLEEEGNLLIEVEASGGDAPVPAQADVDLALGRVEGRSTGAPFPAHAVRLEEARPGLLTIRLELPVVASPASERN
jgi:hypothetical protein